MLESILGANFLLVVRTILDIATLSIVFYVVYRLFRVVKIPLLFNQIAAILIVYIIASLLGLETVLWLLKNTVSWIIIGILVVFQPELRALVMRTDYARLFRRDKSSDTILTDFEKIKNVANFLIKIKRGALFVFPRHIDLEYIISSKVEINADLNEELLQTIFAYDTALHDGAVIIKGDKITHAGCFLPTERGVNVMYNLGSRHRAALGLSQNSDAIIMIVSEEYGSISLVHDGEFLYDIQIDRCCAFIEQLLLEKTNTSHMQKDSSSPKEKSKDENI